VAASGITRRCGMCCNVSQLDSLSRDEPDSHPLDSTAVRLRLLRHGASILGLNLSEQV